MLLSFLLSLLLIPSPVHAQIVTPPVSVQVPAPRTQLNPALVPICTCESGLRQFNKDGSVVHNPHNYASTGVCQINAKVWRAKALSLGFDIDTRDGNIDMANWIYKREGTAPWNSSRAWWDK